jgi:hypothetical protein
VVGNVTQLWNPHGSRRTPRHWISYDERIVIGGEKREQAGELSVRPGDGGKLHARLHVADGDFDEQVAPGEDLAIWINGLRLFVDLIAVEERRMLAAFRAPVGAQVSVTLRA